MSMAVIGSCIRVALDAEQINVQDQSQWHSPIVRVGYPRLWVYRPDLILDIAQPLSSGSVAFVDKHSVGVTQLVAGSNAVESLEAEMFGVRDGHNGIEP